MKYITLAIALTLTGCFAQHAAEQTADPCQELTQRLGQMVEEDGSEEDYQPTDALYDAVDILWEEEGDPLVCALEALHDQTKSGEWQTLDPDEQPAMAERAEWLWSGVRPEDCRPGIAICDR